MINKFTLGKPFKKFFLNSLFKLINKKSFFIYNQRSIVIYKIIKVNSKTPILKKWKTIIINSRIVLLAFSPDTNFIYIYDLNQNLRIYNSKTYKRIRILFLDMNLVFLRKSIVADHILYIVHTTHVSSDFSLSPFKKSYLAIINLDECKYVNIIQLKNLWFYENSINFVNNEKILITVDSDQIIILDFNWNSQTIYKKILYNKIEICSVSSHFELLLIGDRNGFLNLFEFDFNKNIFSKYPNSNHSNLLFLRKTKTWYFHHRICLMFFLRKEEIIINFFGFLEIIHLNYKSEKKNKIKIIQNEKSCVIDLILFKKLDKILIATPNTLLFYNKNLYKSKIHSFHISNLINFFVRERTSTKQKNFNLKIFPLLLVSNSFFLLLGPENNFQFINVDQKIINFNLLINTCFKNLIYAEKKAQTFESDAVGKYIICLNNIKFTEIAKKAEIFPNFSTLIGHIGLKFKSFHFVNKQSHLSIDRKGNRIAAILNDSYVKVWDSKLFTYEKSESISITVFSNKTVSAISISDDGSFLVLAFFNIITIWQLYPEIKKLKSFSLEIDYSVHILKFLSINGEKKIIICSLNEVSLFNMETFTLTWKLKIKILEILTDKWSDIFMIKTKYISTISCKITETIVIFESSSPIPLITVNPMMFFNTNIISFCFSYFNNNKKSLIYLDSFFTVNKLLF
jgi:hypothetical protein